MFFFSHFVLQKMNYKHCIPHVNKERFTVNVRADNDFQKLWTQDLHSDSYLYYAVKGINISAVFSYTIFKYISIIKHINQIKKTHFSINIIPGLCIVVKLLSMLEYLNKKIETGVKSLYIPYLVGILK